MSQELTTAAPSTLSPHPSSLPTTRRAKNRARDLAIFKKVTLENYTHQEIADVYRLDKSRVTQIVARVRRHLARAEHDDPNIENPLARQRLDTKLEEMRLEFLLAKASDALQKQPTSLTTTKQGNSQHKGEIDTWNVAITRELPPTAQIINAYLRVSRRLGELRSSKTKDQPIPSHLQQDELLKAILEAVCNWITASAKFAAQPTDEFKEAMQNFRFMLGRYLAHRISGFAPHECWPESNCEWPSDEDEDEDDEADQPAQPATGPFPATVPESLTPQPSPLTPPQELTKPHHNPSKAHQPLTAPPITLLLPTSTSYST